MMRHLMIFARWLAIGMVLTGGQGQAEPDAHFVVTDRVVAPNPGPFAATIAGVGNGARMVRKGSGFEPIIYRTWFLATEDGRDRITANPQALSNWFTLRSGALDGAEVEVLRVSDGRFGTVRHDRIAEGGFHASGWVPQMRPRQAISPETTRIIVAPSNMPDWRGAYMLRSVGQDGRVSLPSNVVRPVLQENGPDKTPPRPPLVRIGKGKDGGGIDRSLPQPRDLSARIRPDGAVELSWTSARGIAGYRLYRSDTAPADHEGYFIDLAAKGGPPIRRGDLVILRQRFLQPSLRRMHSSRGWETRATRRAFQPALAPFFEGADDPRSWRLAPHTPDTLVTEPGETFMELTLPEGARAIFKQSVSAGPDQDWYPVLVPGVSYRIEMWIKADRPLGAVLRLKGLPVAPSRAAATFDVTSEWQKFSTVFVAGKPLKNRAVGQVMLEVDGPATLGIDNFRMYREGVDYLDLDPVAYDRLARSGMSALRSHALIKTRTRSYDLAQLTNPGGVASGTGSQNTLPQNLGIIARAGKDAWIQVEPHLSADEWLGLIEYLAAPFDPARDTPASKPWAAKRHAQGQHAPWTDRFDRIYFEVANETWNGRFAPWIFQPGRDAATGERLTRGAMYGLYHDHVWRILRQSPHWEAAGLERKITGVLGGWQLGNFSKEAAAHSQTAGLMTIGSYIGGWEVKGQVPQETPEGFFNLLTHAEQTTRPSVERHLADLARINRDRDTPIRFGTYEAGPGYVFEGAGGGKLTPDGHARQERVMKSHAAGTATLDMFLTMAARGAATQNLFLFGEGERWHSHISRHRGDHAHPPWLLLSAFNREATGDFLEVTTRRIPRADLPKRGRTMPSEDAPLIVSYATAKDDQLAVTVISRLVPGAPIGGDGVSRVRLDLPIHSARQVRRLSLSGDYDDHTTITDAVRLEEMALGAHSGPSFTIDALPPGSARIYVFEGVRW